MCAIIKIIFHLCLEIYINTETIISFNTFDYENCNKDKFCDALDGILCVNSM